MITTIAPLLPSEQLEPAVAAALDCRGLTLVPAQRDTEGRYFVSVTHANGSVSVSAWGDTSEQALFNLALYLVRKRKFSRKLFTGERVLTADTPVLLRELGLR